MSADEFDTMTSVDRAEQTEPVYGEPDVIYPAGVDDFVDEADALDQERDAPLDDPDAYEAQ